MSPRGQRRFRKLGIAFVLLVAVGWIAPFFFNAERYRPRLEAGLEQALHRKVSFGRITLHFFPQPGFHITNVVVEEAPAFGMEPFARVDSIDCDLKWRSLWNSQVDLGTLRLHNPSINIVRDAAGEWNIENLLLQSQIANHGEAVTPQANQPPNVEIEANSARLNFKIGQDKKSFAIVNTRAGVSLGQGRMTFRISGNPVRTDLELPTPGLVEMEGTWTPKLAPKNALSVTLRTQGGYLYNWIPLVTGRNPEIYGLINSTVHLTGALRRIKFAGDARISQLHRSEQLPPSDAMPCDVHFTGSIDRDHSRLNIAALNMGFEQSHVRVAGAITGLGSKPDFDLAVDLRRAQLEDLLELGKRVLGVHGNWNATGQVNGTVSIEGRWAERQYHGFVNAREVRLKTSAGTFPVSDVAIRITQRGARLAPARIRLGPGVELTAQGVWGNAALPRSRNLQPTRRAYSLMFSSQAVTLRGLLRFGRALGFDTVKNLDAEGVSAVSLHLTGSSWPLSEASVTGGAEVRSARLLVPGLTQPLNIARARVQIYGRQIVVNPVVAVLGTSVFTGWLMHEGARTEPWRFNLKADRLNIEQGSRWFAASSQSSALSLFERLSGIGSLIISHRNSSDLFGHLYANGSFATPSLSYRGLTLRNFKSTVGIHDRTVRVSKASFEAAGGRGSGKLLVNLKQSPALLSADLKIDGADLQALASYLPPALAKVRGRYFADGHFEAQGLTHREIADSLEGLTTVELRNVNLGDFDPVGFLARRTGMDVMQIAPRSEFISSAVARLQIANRRVILNALPIDFSGAKLELTGSYAFDGAAEMGVHADLSALRRSVPTGTVQGTVPQLADLQFEGSTLRNLAIAPAMRLSQTR